MENAELKCNSKSPYIAEGLYEIDKRQFGETWKTGIDHLSDVDKQKFFELLRQFQSNPRIFFEFYKMGVFSHKDDTHSNLLRIEGIDAENGTIHLHGGVWGICDMEIAVTITNAKDVYPGG